MSPPSVALRTPFVACELGRASSRHLSFGCPGCGAKMLDSLDVKGFKSIRSAAMDLGVVNVFVGANGSGKSNVLEALGVLGATLFGAVDPEPLEYRGVRPGLPSLYKTSLRGARIPRLIRLRAESDGATCSVGLDNPIDRPERVWKIQSESLHEGRQLLLPELPPTAQRAGAGPRTRLHTSPAWPRPGCPPSP